MKAKIKLLVSAVLVCAAAGGPIGETSALALSQTSQEERLPSNENISAVGQALADFDANALLYDQEAARDALRRIDLLEPLLKTAKPEIIVDVNSIRLLALVGLGRADDADALSRQLLRDFPRQPAAYGVRFAIAGARGKPYEMIETIEQADRSASSLEAREQLSTMFAVDSVIPIMRFLYQEKDAAGRHRLAEALLVLNWKAEGDAELVDSYRKLAIDGRLERGDVSGARALADEIETPSPLLDLLVAKKYDPLFDSGVDRVQRLRQAVELEGVRSGRDFNADPDDAKLRLRRIQHLRSVGDNAEVLKLTDAYAADMGLVAEAQEDAFWAINERAYSLLELGRSGEAVALMEKLLGLDMATYPDLVSMSINHAVILNAAGRPSDAFAHAEKLANTVEGYASPYGHMWIWSAAACALAAADRGTEAQPWLDKIEAHRSDNMAALSRTLTCLNRLDEAEAVIVERLSADDPTEMILVLQDYRDDGFAPASEFGKLMEARRNELAARPAVVAALGKVGRILTLPIVKSYWGSF